MLDHVILGLRDVVRIEHRGDAAELVVQRNGDQPGCPFWVDLKFLSGEPFELWFEAHLYSMFTPQPLFFIGHQGARMSARVWYPASGRNKDRFVCSLNGSPEWRFRWENFQQHIDRRATLSEPR